MIEARPRFEIVELLRGFAALAVAWFHLTATHKGTWVAASGAYGWLGVEIFFVISGFIIPYAMQSAFASYSIRHAPTFLIRRIIRIEPPYIVSLFLVVALYHLSALAPGFQGGQTSYSVAQFAVHFLYLVPFTDFQWLQPIYWTLAYEFAFYIFTAFKLPLFCQDNHRVITLAFVTLICIAVANSAIPAYILLFAMGFAVFQKHYGICSAFESIVLISVSIITMMFAGARLEGITGGMTAVIILLGARIRFQPVVASLFGSLGAISYSLYLVHIPIGGRIVNLGRRVIDSPFEALIVSLAALLASFVAAWLLWRFVEVPSIAAARRWGSKDPVVAKTAAS